MSLPVRAFVYFLQMSDSESQSASSGNAFSGEEPEKSSSVGTLDGASSTDSSDSDSRSCSSGTRVDRDRILFATVTQEITTGEDIEPLSFVPYRKATPGSSSTVVPGGGVGGEVPKAGSAVGFKVDQLPLSASTDGDLAQLREAFKIPSSVTTRLPEKGELRSASVVPGETLVHPFFFGEGLRIPLPAYQQRFLAEVGLAIAQLNPNTWRYLNALYTLYHHCGFGEPDLTVFFSQWALEEHSKSDKGWYKAKTVLKAGTECPRDTEWMEVESRYRSVSRCCLMRDALVREDMAGQFDIEAHEIGSPDIIKDPLVFGNPTSQQTWRSRYFFVGGEWEFPVGSVPSAKRVPCHFQDAPG